MNKTDLLVVILDQKQQALPQKYIERLNVEINPTDPFVQIFSGVRRCGKSTLMQNVRKQSSEQDYYLNFDDDRLLNFEIKDFQKLYEIFLEQFGEQKTFYFDEIQNIAGWERFIRRLYDNGNKVYLTGSNANLLSKELGTHLTGRNIQTEVFPFAFKEFLRFNDFEIQNTPNYNTLEKTKLKQLFNQYFEQGGFPEFLMTQNPDYLKNLYSNILYRDIIVKYKLPNENPIKKLALFCASNIGKLISYNKLKSLIEVSSPATVREYLEYFENSYLFFTVTKFDYSLKKQINAPKKIYCIDTRLSQEIGFRMTQDQGRYLENIVFLELKRQGKEIYYYAEKQECDFVIKQGDRISEVIQVSLSVEDTETYQREINGLLAAMEKYELTVGLLLTENEEKETIVNGKKIFVLPVWKWLLQISGGVITI